MSTIEWPCGGSDVEFDNVVEFDNSVVELHNVAEFYDFPDWADSVFTVIKKKMLIFVLRTQKLCITFLL